MVRELERTEISEAPDLASLVEEVRASGRPLALTRNGEELAVLTPRKTAGRSRSKSKARTETDVAAFRAAAGGWKGKVDVDQFLKDNAESRRISSRPPVIL